MYELAADHHFHLPHHVDCGQSTAVTVKGSFLDVWVTVNTGSVELDSLMYPTNGSGPLPQYQWQYIATPDASDPTETATVWAAFTECDPQMTTCPWPASVTVQIIGCSKPTIASITPLGWWATGQPQSITINGNCFLTSSDTNGPSKVTVTDGANAVTLSNVSVVSANQITAIVNVTKKAPAETVTLTVTDPPNSGTPGSATANPAPVVLPVPIIQWKGKEISGDNAKEKSVIVGQPVELTTTPATLPGGFTISQSTWDIDGTTIKKYTGDDSGITLEDTDLNTQNTTFYWLYPDDPLNVTYEYCATDPSSNQMCTSPQAKATFKATRPTISMDTWDSDEASIEHLDVCDPKTGKRLEGEDGTAPYLGYGYYTGPGPSCKGDQRPNPVGIKFTASGSPADGKYWFVQVILSDSRTYTYPAGGSYTGGPFSGLDGGYPYDALITPAIAQDGPEMPLSLGYATGSRAFHAKMYLLWQPGKLSQATAPSIPVPIGYQEWQFGATADGAQAGKKWKWKDPTISPSTDHGGIGGFINSAENDPGTQDGYPQWNCIAGQVCK
jgi:hypothetical protein